MEDSLKEKVRVFCQDYATSKIVSVKGEIEKLNESLGSETKSTAGDKHETGRAMIQLEREKLGRQLLEAEKTKVIFERIPSKYNSTSTIGLGSLVRTDSTIYFMAISAGRFVEDGDEVFCISVATPIGKLLLGKSLGDVISFNGVNQKVLEVR